MAKLVMRRLLLNAQDVIVLGLDELGGEGKELEVAVRFSDIGNFTTHSEESLPYDVVYFLNRHFAAAAEPVLNNNGLVDKYIGDGILAAFGTRGESSTSTCRNAVRAHRRTIEGVWRALLRSATCSTIDT